MKRILKRFVAALVEVFGSEVVDQRTGEVVGRAFIVPRRATAKLIGLHTPYVRPVFLPEDRVRYGRHRIGFATHAPVDFCRIRPPALRPEAGARRVLWAVLVHHSAAECRSILAHWTASGIDGSDLLLVHGGNRSDFESIDFGNAVFVPDAALRTVRHPVEKQSYAGPMREVACWLGDHPHSHVCLVEYDHRPLVADWAERLLELLDGERADVLFPHLTRVDGTNAPHYAHHLAGSRFASAWQALSSREDPRLVLNCMATGSFWTREAFEVVAACPEPFPIYLEMYLPTTAHHLGFRVRDLGPQSAFITVSPQTAEDLGSAGARGAWSLHPVKEELRQGG